MCVGVGGGGGGGGVWEGGRGREGGFMCGVFVYCEVDLVTSN